jgi:hypothetical protein
VKNQKLNCFFSQKLGYSFWGIERAERKKEWNMEIMIINEKKNGTKKGLSRLVV